MKLINWAVSSLAMMLIVVIAMCFNMTKHIVILREKLNTRLSETDVLKNQYEEQINKLDKKELEVANGTENAAQIAEESQFAVAITRATAMEEALGSVYSPNASGFVVKIDDEIYIVTVKHACIGEGGRAEKMLIHFKPSTNGEILNSESADIVDVCPYHDIGLLKIKNKKFVFPWAPGILGISRNNKIGEKIFVLGSPLGDLFCITDGCIMSTDPVGLSTDKHERITEHSAPSNYGGSGGPILNSLGKIVGMASMIRIVANVPIRIPSSIGLAIPSDIISQDITKIARHQKISHSKVDANFGNSWELNEFTKGWEADPPKQHGIIVTQVTFGSDASLKGLKRRDLILECSGVKPKNAGILIEMILLKDNDETIELKIRHENETEEKITLELSPLH